MADGQTPPDKQPTDPKKPGGTPGPRLPRNVASWLFLLGLALLLVMVLQNSFVQSQEISMSEFEKLVSNQAISELTIRDEDGIIEGVRKRAQGDAPNAPLNFTVNFPRGAIDSKLLLRLNRELPGANIESARRSQFLLVLVSMLPYILLFGILWFFIIRQFRGAGGAGGMLGNFGRSKHRITQKEHTNVTLADVAGIEEAKEEIGEIIEFLRSPKKFQRLGARIPRGVLLVGAPGCGKTLLAKAIAGEADVPFFSISGSDFVEMFVGVGASRVRDLFKQAKENSPCIIFLDEIDAVGRRRGANFAGGGHDEREQTLNAILVEMDGFDTSDQVIVIAATNRSDILDPALTRPGRFDRRVDVPLPDVRGRLEILKVHAKKIKLASGVDLMRLARGTPMFTGAELAAIINEAAIIATMQEKEVVELDDLEDARDKVRYGRSNKSRAIEEKERLATAYHEAGHAVLQVMLEDADPLHKVTIIPRGQTLGATMSLPEKDRYGFGLKWLLATTRVMCGGRIAEFRHSKDISSGAAMDIEQATKIARAMILDWGMSEKLGFVKYSPDPRTEAFISEKSYSDETARIVDEEVRRIIDEAYRDAERLLGKHWEKVDAVAQALLKHETLDADEVARLCAGESLDKPTLSGILANESPPPPPARPIAQPTKPELPSGGLGDGTLPQPG